jgi:transcriptional regulator with XRE-family HTH domain
MGRDIAIARRKRRLTTAMMAERMGVSRPTFLRVERGDPTVGLGVYAMALFVLGLGMPFGDLVDASRDDQALVLDIERLPERVRPRTQPAEL